MPPVTILPKSEWPKRLFESFPPPKQLYIRGVLPDLDTYKCIAVVGARRHSEYGMQVCQSLIQGLAGYPILIISGLAIGIDSIAHEAALKAGLLTMALPGSGLNNDVIYPKSKFPLARRILEKGGCLLSEYPPDLIASPWTFPERNRIMAALADAVLIIEAERKSGTLITARIALDYNKDVLAVPGPITSSLTEGPHFLIKQGATPIASSRDIVEAVGLIWYEKEEEAKSQIESSKTLFAGCAPIEKELLALLPSTRNDLVRNRGKPPQDTYSLLTLLEIKGLIKEDAGKIYPLHKAT